ncbi:Hint domain-containing protein, partial [Kitasatospora indigofera]|uniref:Hint domain-containing protein n=1 Tax=Kitasatospora indigofera TaxID=67307 RepID=UPI0033B29495
AEVASYIPGPIGGIAAAVSAVSYAATGNWAKAAEMTITAAASLVGANTAVKAAMTTVKATRAATRVGKAASAARSAYRITANAARKIFNKCNSFAPETFVLMADGSYLPIEEIEVGDYVSAVDPESGEASSKPVLEVYVGYGEKHLIEISTTGPGSPIVATGEHPMLMHGRGWVSAEMIETGDRLVAADGSFVSVASIRDLGQVSDALVYNLSVGDVHTFAIHSGNYDLVVHNDGVYCKHGRAPGSKFTKAGKRHVWRREAEANNGIAICRDCRITLVKPKQSKKGVTPPRNEGHVDHVFPKSKGGQGCRCNGELRCGPCNIGKSNN